MASASVIAKMLSCDIIEVVHILYELKYIEKDKTRNRDYIITEEGYKHGKYVTVSFPSRDVETIEKIKNKLQKD